jgi:hypothetical protein
MVLLPYGRGEKTLMTAKRKIVYDVLGSDFLLLQPKFLFDHAGYSMDLRGFQAP